MNREEQVMEIMESLVIATDKDVGEVMAARGHWAEGQSARVNAGKALKKLSELGKIERGDGYFRLRGCRSDFKEHSQLITRHLVQIKKLPIQSIVIREHFIEAVSLRPDSIILLVRDGQACCLVLEVQNHEGEQSIEKKRNVWAHWPEATAYLSKLFDRPVPHFDFVTSEQLTSYLKELI